MNNKNRSTRLASRLTGLFYSAACYLLFLVTVLYLIGFLASMIVPKAINDGPNLDWRLALLIDSSLVILFAIQHTGMARKCFKTWLARFVPMSVERSTYVLFSSLLLLLIFWLWQPITATVWNVESVLGRALLTGLFWLGWGIVFLATLLISHFELFGLKQAIDRFRNTPPSASSFRTPLLYRVVRHPLYLGFLIAFWATPDMTTGHLLFAVGFTIYLFIGAHAEEKDLVALFGETYQRYQRRTPMIFPVPKVGSGIRKNAPK